MEATTNDGKKVLLYKNGTWKYVKKTTSSSIVREELKNEALNFSKTIVRSYFTKDYTILLKSLPNEVYTIKEVIKVTDDVKQKLCKSLNSAVLDTSKSFSDYENDYKMEVLSKAELETKMNVKLPEHFKTTESDFFFLGFEKKSKDISSKYIWDDVFSFMIRKVDGKWEFKAILGG
jgi:hypothetical protein